MRSGIESIAVAVARRSSARMAAIALLLGSLYRAQIAHQLLDLLCRLAMSGLVVSVVTEEFVTPHRHVTRTVRAEVGLAVNDPVDLELRKIPAAPRGNERQVRHCDPEQRCDWAVTVRVLAMTTRAVASVQACAMCGFRGLVCWNAARRVTGTPREQSTKNEKQ
jgi:hypothetical protein